MREFIAFDEYGNFSKTAQSMYITQPALSRHIAEMEKELGVKLLERNKHSVSFTEAGLKVYKQLRKISLNAKSWGLQVAGIISAYYDSP